MHPAAPRPRNAPTALWDLVHIMVNLIRTEGGSPAALMLTRSIGASTWRRLMRYVRAGEHLLTRVLLIEASFLSFDTKSRAAPKPNDGKYRPHLIPLPGPFFHLPRKQIADAPQGGDGHASHTNADSAASAERASSKRGADRDVSTLLRRVEGLFNGVRFPHLYTRKLALRLARDRSRMEGLITPPRAMPPFYNQKHADEFREPVAAAVAAIKLPTLRAPRPRLGARAPTSPRREPLTGVLDRTLGPRIRNFNSS